MLTANVSAGCFKKACYYDNQLEQPAGTLAASDFSLIFDVVRRRTEEQLVHVQVSAAKFGVKARPAHIEDPETRHT